MKLPSSGITWKEYRNTTPTFDLTPIEKPDFSPFLIHMTGKNSLVSILKGENAPDGKQIGEKEGYLKAVIPSFEGQQAYYSSRVVCFTESPIFALDFFRYRSFRRWRDNQQFGIGFSKKMLIKKNGVRPVLYLDTDTNKEILSLCGKILDKEHFITDTSGNIVNYEYLFEKIKPLLFPLLENTDYQGFMWEREWRCPDEEGLIFTHDSIKVICCPNDERGKIEEILGDHAENIDIVESWREYDDVTNYLKRRKNEVDYYALNKIKEIRDLGTLKELRTQNEQTLNTLIAYYEVFKETVNNLEDRNISETLNNLKKKSLEIDKQIDTVEEEIKKEREKKKAENKKSTEDIL